MAPHGAVFLPTLQRPNNKMQEALLQSCRRSARLLKRASDASAATAAGLHHPAVTRALHHSTDVTPPAAPDAAADGGTKRRRRRAVTAAAKEDASPPKSPPQHKQQQDPAAAAAPSQLQALGSITNRADVLGSIQAAAAGAGAAAAGTAAAAAAPPAKRPRGRPPRAPPAAVPEDADASTHADAAAAAAAPAGKGRGKASSKNSSSSKSSSSSGPTRAAEQRLWAQGFQAVAGVDEAGRGPLAGPVVAAAAVLPPGVEFALLNDSKQMNEEEREEVYEQLTTHPEVSYAVAVVDAATIDRINILQAAMLAMRTAVEGLAGAGLAPDHLLIDGNRKPAGLDDTPTQLVVKGDASVTCIAAASVLAKVTRDRMMQQLDAQYPQYGFAQHKGYGVPAHKAAIQQHGPCPEHRRSFEPVKSLTQWPGYPKPPGAAAGTVTVAVARQQQVQQPRSGAGAGGAGGDGVDAAV